MAAEPETTEELETALARFIERESEQPIFVRFVNMKISSRNDAELLVIDLTAKFLLADSTYYYARRLKNSVRKNAL